MNAAEWLNMIGIGRRYAATLICVLACLNGCSSGKRPFRQIQFCLAGPQEIEEFTSRMDKISQNYKMEFGDRSGQTQSELEFLHSDNKEVPVNNRIVNIYGSHSSAFSFGAGNAGMPTNQIVIGFNGDDLTQAMPFADAVVRDLSVKWHVHEVPEGGGAFPLQRCD